MLKRIFYIKQIKYSVKTVTLGLIPVSLAILIFEILFDIKPYLKQIENLDINDNYDIKMLIYYIISGLSHIIICSIISYHFLVSNNRNAPNIILKKNHFIKFLVVALLFFSVYLLDKLHTNIAVLSHERLYVIMSKSDFFKKSFYSFPKDYIPFLKTSNWFHMFSLLPFVLICFALIVMVFGSFYIGKEIHYYTNQTEIEIKKVREYIKNINSILRNYVQLLSVVLVSSTVATVLFFQIPTYLLKNSILRSEYSGLSIAMGISWGVIFSLTLLFLCIYPYRLIYSKITTLLQENRVKDDVDLEKWLEVYKSHYSLMGNMKLLISIMSPALASILTTVITKNL